MKKRTTAMIAGLMTATGAAAQPAPAPAPSAAAATHPALAAAWERYYRTLPELRRQIEASEQYKSTPEQRAKAYHVLMEIQAMAYNFAVAPRMAQPRIFRNTGWQTELYTMGGNGPDFDYRTLFLDGRHSYRLTGNVRDSRVVLAQLSGALPGSKGAKAARNYDFADFQVKPDGSFEILMSAQKQPGNWIELDPNAPYQWLLFRPTVDTPESKAAEFRIERVDPIAADAYAADDFDPQAVARRIDMATDFARYMVDEWVVNFYQRTMRNAGGPNRFKTLTSEIAGEVGSPTAQYVMGVYDVKDDEALIIELPEEPKGAYWSFQIFDIWLRSIDFRTRQSSLNAHQIAKDPDGRIRLVLSRKDPGIANWLDTGGFAKGQMLLRNYRTPKPADVAITLVKFDQLAETLPKGVKRVTPQERTQALALRAAGYLKRHGE